MELKILTIGDKGSLLNERIGLKALKKCQLKYFLVIKTRKINNGFFNVSENAYWFLPQEVNENDQVVLYSKKGVNSIIENVDGTKTYFFFWGLTKAIFDTDISTVVLVNANTWQMND